MFNNLSEESHKWKKLVIIKINFISIKLLYLYIFDSFCHKKLVDIDHRGWTYFFAGDPVVMILDQLCSISWNPSI